MDYDLTNARQSAVLISEEEVRRMLGMSGKPVRIRTKWQGEEEEGQQTTTAESIVSCEVTAGIYPHQETQTQGVL